MYFHTKEMYKYFKQDKNNKKCPSFFLSNLTFQRKVIKISQASYIVLVRFSMDPQTCDALVTTPIQILFQASQLYKELIQFPVHLVHIVLNGFIEGYWGKPSYGATVR